MTTSKNSSLRPEVAMLSERLGLAAGSLIDHGASLVPDEDRDSERTHWEWFFVNRSTAQFERFPHVLSMMIGLFRDEPDLTDKQLAVLDAVRKNVETAVNEFMAWQEEHPRELREPGVLKSGAK